MDLVHRQMAGILCICVLMLAGGCDFLTGHRERAWSEDVDIDGRTAVIDRRVRFKVSDSLAGDAYNKTETSSTLSFRDDLSELPDWNVPLIPLLLYRDSATREWVIVATTSDCHVWSQRGSPDRPYWEYRLKGATWAEVPLSETSVGRKTNLYFKYDKEVPKHVPLGNKGVSGRTFKKLVRIQPEPNDYCR
jgi:hypothetical protein